MAHLHFEEGAAEGGPGGDDLQEVDPGLVGRDAHLLVVG